MTLQAQTLAVPTFSTDSVTDFSAPNSGLFCSTTGADKILLLLSELVEGCKRMSQILPLRQAQGIKFGLRTESFNSLPTIA